MVLLGDGSKENRDDDHQPVELIETTKSGRPGGRRVLAFWACFRINHCVYPRDSLHVALLIPARGLVGQFVRLREAGVLVPDHLLLPIVRNQQTARVVLRSPVECQSNVITAHDLV